MERNRRGRGKIDRKIKDFSISKFVPAAQSLRVMERHGY